MAQEEVVAIEEAIPVEPKPGEEPVIEPVVKKEPRTYTQEDLDRITAKVKKNARYQTRKEIEAYYQGRDSRPEQRVDHKSNGEDKPPERGDFDTYEEFLNASASFSGHRAAREATQKASKELDEKRVVEEKQKIYTNFQTKLHEKYPDIDERIEDISEINLSELALQAIAESEVGPDILSYFADNPKDCERIAALSPSSAVREIGKLETRFEGGKPPTRDAKEEPKIVTSKAPKPLTPGGGESPTTDVAKDSDSIEDWMRKERARGRKKVGL